MAVVDAHHHLWDLSRGRYPWLQQAYDPRAFFLGDYAELRRNFLPADYRAASAGVRGARDGARGGRARPQRAGGRDRLAARDERCARLSQRRGRACLARPARHRGVPARAPALSAGARHPQQAGDVAAPGRQRRGPTGQHAGRGLAARLLAAGETRPELGHARALPGTCPKRPRSRPCSRGCRWSSTTTASPGTAARKALQRWRGWMEVAGAPAERACEALRVRPARPALGLGCQRAHRARHVGHLRLAALHVRQQLSRGRACASASRTWCRASGACWTASHPRSSRP